MGRFSTEGSKSFTPPPVGTHVARCFKIVDIGTQRGEFQGKPTERNQVILFWELPDEMVDTDDGQRPSIVTKFFTNSLNEKANLRADLEAWRGRAFTAEELKSFDLSKILGAPCLMTIIADGEKTRIASITALPKAMKCPAQVNPSDAFWIDEWSDEKFNALSDGMKKLIQKSVEYQTTHPTTASQSPTHPRTKASVVNTPPPENPLSNEPEFKADDIPF